MRRYFYEVDIWNFNISSSSPFFRTVDGVMSSSACCHHHEGDLSPWLSTIPWWACPKWPTAMQSRNICCKAMPPFSLLISIINPINRRSSSWFHNLLAWSIVKFVITASDHTHKAQYDYSEHIHSSLCFSSLFSSANCNTKISLMWAWEILRSCNDSKNMPRRSHHRSCLSFPIIDHVVNIYTRSFTLSK